ncbi:MAG: transcriptional regulator [Clostridiaceae bacterium BRH_c20a]|nr:MAG: transcriptional regulator [Clostridiaceae bacterium BRH_c20a]
MGKPLKILLVDDEEGIKKIVQQILIKEGYNFLYAANGERALDVFSNEDPALIILDVMLPEIDGFEVCKTIRQSSNVPIIMLSAKSDIVDKSVGFNMGADDYLTKPFSPIELSLRVKALIRRVVNRPLNKCEKKDWYLCMGGLEINCANYEVKLQGKIINFTPKEFDLLCFLVRNPGQVFTREQLYNQLWDEDLIGDTGTITVFVRRIREKIEKDPAKPKYLQTVWGVGYKFCNM